jgi:hypothetical protein
MLLASMNKPPILKLFWNLEVREGWRSNMRTFSSAAMSSPVLIPIQSTTA